MNPNKLKHLEFIQAVITRMNTNSFLIKAWSISIVSALFALSAKDINVNFVFIAYFSIPLMWLLDGFYLSQERKFRDLYNSVRVKDEGNIDFSMKTKNYDTCKNSWMGSTFSRTLLLMYFPLTLVVCLVMVILRK